MLNPRPAVPWRCPSGSFSCERDAPSQLKGEGGRQQLVHWFFSVGETVTRTFIFCVACSPLSFCDCLSRPHTIYRKQRASRFPYEDTRHREVGLSAALSSARAGVLAAHFLASRPWGTYLTSCAVVPSSAEGTRESNLPLRLFAGLSYAYRACSLLSPLAHRLLLFDSHRLRWLEVLNLS